MQCVETGKPATQCFGCDAGSPFLLFERLVGKRFLAFCYSKTIVVFMQSFFDDHKNFLHNQYLLKCRLTYFGDPAGFLFVEITISC